MQNFKLAQGGNDEQIEMDWVRVGKDGERWGKIRHRGKMKKDNYRLARGRLLIDAMQFLWDRLQNK